MGMRLTIYKMQRSEWERCKASNAKTLEELNPIADKMIYDWCTDAFLDIYNQCAHRLTPHKLDDECEVFVGILDKEGFKALAKQIHKIASECAIDWCMELSALAEVSNPWELGYGGSWHAAFYTAAYILKNIDWDNEVIYCYVG